MWDRAIIMAPSYGGRNKKIQGLWLCRNPWKEVTCASWVHPDIVVTSIDPRGIKKKDLAKFSQLPYPEYPLPPSFSSRVIEFTQLYWKSIKWVVSTLPGPHSAIVMAPQAAWRLPGEPQLAYALCPLTLEICLSIYS